MRRSAVRFRAPALGGSAGPGLLVPAIASPNRSRRSPVVPPAPPTGRSGVILRKPLVAAAPAVVFSLGLAWPAFTRSGSTNGTRQPSQSCGSSSAPNTPAQSSSAPGSAFNPSGQAGSVYAGEQPQNSSNPLSVSQYDVACYQTSPHQGRRPVDSAVGRSAQVTDHLTARASGRHSSAP